MAGPAQGWRRDRRARQRLVMGYDRLRQRLRRPALAGPRAEWGIYDHVDLVIGTWVGHPGLAGPPDRDGGDLRRLHEAFDHRVEGGWLAGNHRE